MAIKFDIKESYGTISESPKGWKKELRSISWNDRSPKFDIREWSPDNSKMGKGITLSHDEMVELKRILNDMNI